MYSPANSTFLIHESWNVSSPRSFVAAAVVAGVVVDDPSSTSSSTPRGTPTCRRPRATPRPAPPTAPRRRNDRRSSDSCSRSNSSATIASPSVASPRLRGPRQRLLAGTLEGLRFPRRTRIDERRVSHRDPAAGSRDAKIWPMRDLRTLPKAHLHVHLEGAMRPDTLRELRRASWVSRCRRSRGFGNFSAFSRHVRGGVRTC